MKNLIGVDKECATKISTELNILLASYQVFYQNLRGFHWNVAGPNFFELHAKFETMYTDAAVSVDEIAERILKLENTPIHTFNDYIKASIVPQEENVVKDTDTVQCTVNNMSVLLGLEKNILKIASEAEDEGTIVLMDDLIAYQEKAIWMFNAFLKNV